MEDRAADRARPPGPFADLEPEARARLVGVLHDSVMQQLLAVGISLEALIGQPPGADLGVGQLAQCASIVSEVLTELRTVVVELAELESSPGPRSCDRPPTTVRAVGRVIDQMMLALGFAPSFTCDVGLVLEPDLTRDVETVVREALANVAKHATASSASLAIRTDDRRLIIELADDGRWQCGSEHWGHGLRSLEHRAEVRGGSMTVAAGSSGTRLVWSVPIAIRAEQRSCEPVSVQLSRSRGLASR